MSTAVESRRALAPPVAHLESRPAWMQPFHLPSTEISDHDFSSGLAALATAASCPWTRLDNPSARSGADPDRKTWALEPAVEPRCREFLPKIQWSTSPLLCSALVENRHVTSHFPKLPFVAFPELLQIASILLLFSSVNAFPCPIV